MSDDNMPASVYYPGPYNNQAAYGPGALVADSSHVYVCTGYVSPKTGEDSNTAPGDDSSNWDLLL